MGELADKVRAVPRNRGGQPHQLKTFVEQHPELRDDIISLLMDPNANLPELARIMREEHGFSYGNSAYNRWSMDLRTGKLVL